MNFAAHQEKKKKNEKTNTGKREAEEERKRTTNFKEAVCCPSAVVQRAAWQINVCVRGVPWVAGTLGRPNSHFDQPKRGRGPHYHIEAAVDWFRV